MISEKKNLHSFQQVGETAITQSLDTKII